MSKVHECPVKRFPGRVTMPEYLNYMQVLAFRDAVSKAQELGADVTLLEYNHVLLPGLIACVEKWDIPALVQPVTADTFPVAPNVPAQALTAWLLTMVTGLMSEADDIPNG